MKKALFLLVILLSNFSQIKSNVKIYSPNHDINNSLNENRLVIHTVVAAIATSLLPETIEAVCSITVGDPKVCDAVYSATKMLVSLKGPKIFRGISNGIKYSLHKRSSRSFVICEAATYQLASKIKKAFDFYNSINCIIWDFVKIDINNELTIEKSTSISNSSKYKGFDFELSYDGGLSWTPGHVPAKSSKAYNNGKKIYIKFNPLYGKGKKIIRLENRKYSFDYSPCLFINGKKTDYEGWKLE